MGTKRSCGKTKKPRKRPSGQPQLDFFFPKPGEVVAGRSTVPSTMVNSDTKHGQDDISRDIGGVSIEEDSNDPTKVIPDSLDADIIAIKRESREILDLTSETETRGLVGSNPLDDSVTALQHGSMDVDVPGEYVTSTQQESRAIAGLMPGAVVASASNANAGQSHVQQFSWIALGIPADWIRGAPVAHEEMLEETEAPRFICPMPGCECHFKFARHVRAHLQKHMKKLEPGSSEHQLAEKLLAETKMLKKMYRHAYCRCCGTSHKDGESIDLHYDALHPNEPKPKSTDLCQIFLCTVCGEKCKGIEGRSKHIQDKHPGDPDAVFVQIYQCLFCDETFERPQDRVDHVKEQHSSHSYAREVVFGIWRPFKCVADPDNCQETFALKGNGEKHLNRWHLDLIHFWGWGCPEPGCEEYFRTNQKRKLHMLKQHPTNRSVWLLFPAKMIAAHEPSLVSKKLSDRWEKQWAEKGRERMTPLMWDLCMEWKGSEADRHHPFLVPGLLSELTEYGLYHFCLAYDDRLIVANAEKECAPAQLMGEMVAFFRIPMCAYQVDTLLSRVAKTKGVAKHHSQFIGAGMIVEAWRGFIYGPVTFFRTRAHEYHLEHFDASVHWFAKGLLGLSKCLRRVLGIGYSNDLPRSSKEKIARLDTVDDEIMQTRAQADSSIDGKVLENLCDIVHFASALERYKLDGSAKAHKEVSDAFYALGEDIMNRWSMSRQCKQAAVHQLELVGWKFE